MYKFEIKDKENIVLITFEGLIPKEEGKRIFEELSSKLKSFDTCKYNLVIDTRELKVSKQDSVDNIKRTIELFVKTSFKGRYNISPKSTVTDLQAKRVSGNDIFSKITHVKSYESLLKVCENL